MQLIVTTLIHLILTLTNLSFQINYQQNNIRNAIDYQARLRKAANIKYILLWSSNSMPFFPPFRFFGTGQRVFYRNNCPYTNCYLTRHRRLLNGEVQNFDAILFNSYHLHNLKRDKDHLPEIRSQKQKYIFVSQETNDHYPICDEFYDDFFNWTQTFRLDSDIPLPYIGIKNKKGEVVGPRIDTEWINEYDNTVDDDLMKKLRRKKKPVAWFVSHCTSASRRADFMNALRKELMRYGMTIDIYGKCGNMHCQHFLHDSEHILNSTCDSMLEDNYFFYLALENSIAQDYITEKVMRPLQHHTVPIIYGGAEYLRFLPPGSYIDALNQTVEELAFIIQKNVNSLDDYKTFFAWRRHYTVYDPRPSDNACALCTALNNKTKFETPSTRFEFRRWWDPKFEQLCELGRSWK